MTEEIRIREKSRRCARRSPGTSHGRSALQTQRHRRCPRILPEGWKRAGALAVAVGVRQLARGIGRCRRLDARTRGLSRQ
eukprot:1535125-Pyramimonas_sp.AAC.1